MRQVDERLRPQASHWDGGGICGEVGQAADCDVSNTPPAKMCRKSSNCGRTVGQGLQIAAEVVVAIGIAASLSWSDTPIEPAAGV